MWNQSGVGNSHKKLQIPATFTKGFQPLILLEISQLILPHLYQSDIVTKTSSGMKWWRGPSAANKRMRTGKLAEWPSKSDPSQIAVNGIEWAWVSRTICVINWYQHDSLLADAACFNFSSLFLFYCSLKIMQIEPFFTLNIWLCLSR